MGQKLNPSLDSHGHFTAQKAAFSSPFKNAM